MKYVQIYEPLKMPDHTKRPAIPTMPKSEFNHALYSTGLSLVLLAIGMNSLVFNINNNNYIISSILILCLAILNPIVGWYRYFKAYIDYRFDCLKFSEATKTMESSERRA